MKHPRPEITGEQENVYAPQVSGRTLLIGIINALGALARELTGKGLYTNLDDKGTVIFADDRKAFINAAVKDKSIAVAEGVLAHALEDRSTP